MAPLPLTLQISCITLIVATAPALHDQCTLTGFSAQRCILVSPLPSHSRVLPEICHLAALSWQGPVSDIPQTLPEDTFLSPSRLYIFYYYFRFFLNFFKFVIYQKRLKLKNIIESHHHHHHKNGLRRKLVRWVLVLSTSTRMAFNVRWQFGQHLNLMALALGTESIIPLLPDLRRCCREVCCQT